jgi:hypothetical protein
MPLPSVSAKEVYRIIRQTWQPFLRNAGFRKGEGPLSWRRESTDPATMDPEFYGRLFRGRTWRGPGPVEPYASPLLVIDVTCGPAQWDSYFGSGFSVTFDPGPAHIHELLSPDKRDELYAIQAQVIETLPPPPRSRYEHLPLNVRDWYLSNFEIPQSYDANTQVWMRYHSPEHVHRWAQFLLPEFPALLKRHSQAGRNWLRWRECPKCGGLGQPKRDGLVRTPEPRQFVCPYCGLSFTPARELTADESAGFVEYIAA